MEKLIAELKRLYLPAYTAPPDTLARHLLGQASVEVKLTTLDGRVRALALPFFRAAAGAHQPDGQHWQRLCDIANALQAELDLPAPAVSIDGAEGYRLWLSFESPVPADEAQHFIDLLAGAYAPGLRWPHGLIEIPVALPPTLNPHTGKWAAFIHPGMGGAFADEPALEVEPPLAGQVAFLEGLESIKPAQFKAALERLAPVPAPAAPAPGPLPEAAATVATGFPGDLLLKDATLEDIVRFLHARNIEPTFRHLLKPQSA